MFELFQGLYVQLFDFACGNFCIYTQYKLYWRPFLALNTRAVIDCEWQIAATVSSFVYN